MERGKLFKATRKDAGWGVLMSYLLSIIVFFATTYGLGASMLRFLKEADEPIERHGMRVGLGIALMVILGVVLHLAGISLKWWIFLLIALPLPLYDLYRWYSSREERARFSIKKSTLYALGAVLIAAIALSMYLSGAFSYTHLEDGDPWHHAISVRYVAEEQVLYTDYHKGFRYLDAYPPGYAIILGMAYQLSQDAVWTLKVFNALIIALGIFFFYLFINRWFGDHTLALVATAILAMIPAYFSHFIWSHTLAVALFFPLFYAAIRMQEDHRWWIPGAMLVGAMLMVNPEAPLKGFVMLACLGIAHILHERRLWKYYALIFIAGIAISALWWGAMMLRYDNVLEAGLGQKPTTSERWSSKDHFGPLGSATRLYTAKDFFSASAQNMITAPVGIGFVPMVLAILGLVLAISQGKKLLKSNWKETVLLLWIIFTFMGLYGGTKLPLALFTFRFWLIFPIPVAILAAQASVWLAQRAKAIGVPHILTLIVIVALTGYSAGAVKWDLNTMQWSADPGMYKYGQQDAYEFIRSLPKKTRVFDVCSREKFGDHILVSYDMETCFWCVAEREFRKSIISPIGWAVTPQELREFLDENRYEYLLMEGNCIDTLQRKLAYEFNITDEFLAKNSTTTFINDVASSGLFRPVHQTQGSIIFEV